MRKSLARYLGSSICAALLPALLLVSSTAEAQTSAPDIEQWEGRFGVGWSGLNAIPLHPTTSALRTVNAPTIGVRHWLDSSKGLDLAFGLHVSGGSRVVRDGDTSTETDDPTILGLLLHGGLPLVMDKGQHTAFLFTPQLGLGFATTTIRPPGNAQSIAVRGMLVQLGATVGFELFFGFIGMPQLSLDAGVGMALQAASASTAQGNQRVRATEFGLTTSVGADPWSIFRAQVAARYYF